MKTTVFVFELQLGEPNREAQFEKLQDTLIDVPGVLRTNGCTTALGFECRVQVEFLDAEAAKTLHRKLMCLLMKTPGLEILSVKSNLTDIF